MTDQIPSQDELTQMYDDIRLLVGGESRLGFTPNRKQREAAVERLRSVVFREEP